MYIYILMGCCENSEYLYGSPNDKDDNSLGSVFGTTLLEILKPKPTLNELRYHLARGHAP